MVEGNASKIKRGTAVATLVNGKYPNQDKGNHAGFYVSQDANGIVMVDQWETLPKPHKRTLKFLGKEADGSFKDPSNNADAFSVIELLGPDA